MEEFENQYVIRIAIKPLGGENHINSIIEGTNSSKIFGNKFLLIPLFRISCFMES